jgi:hypothetical protein
VLAACGEHVSGWGIVRASDHFADEAELSRSNHILDAWYVVEHLTQDPDALYYFPNLFLNFQYYSQVRIYGSDCGNKRWGGAVPSQYRNEKTMIGSVIGLDKVYEGQNDGKS